MKKQDTFCKLSLFFHDFAYIMLLRKTIYNIEGCDLMNITALSSTNISLSGTSNMNAIDISMLKKTLNSVEANGDMLTQMMEQSVNPFVGANIDIKV